MSKGFTSACAHDPVRGAPALRLLCFPYAGGGASAYRGFRALLPPDVEVCALQLPGREMRLRERPLTSLAAAVELLRSETAALRTAPYAFFGHSLGGLLAFELTRALRRRGERLPEALIVSACRAPQLAERGVALGQLDDGALLASLRAFEGTPSRVLEDSELLPMLLPALRADFALRDDYVHCDEPPLPLPITAFGGEEDEHVPLETLFGWRVHTATSFSLARFAGGHFYFRDQPAFGRALDGALARVMRGGRGPSLEEYSDATRL